MTSGEGLPLAAMPLHAITLAYGEEGLRERFAIETHDLPPPARARIGRALALAGRLHAADRRLHAADRRQSEPYVSHLLRVATRIACYYRVRDPEVLCAALLHDAVEDHAADLAPGGGQRGAVAAIAARFGPRVAGLVAAVTNPQQMSGTQARRHEQYRNHVAASLAASPWARVIKFSDFTDNGVALIHITGPPPRLAAKYSLLVPVLRDLVSRPDTPLAGDVRQRILGQLGRAEEHFAVVLAGPGRC